MLFFHQHRSWIDCMASFIYSGNTFVSGDCISNRTKWLVVPWVIVGFTNNSTEGLSLLQIPYNGNNSRKKMFANWQLFPIHEKKFANGDNLSRIYSFLVQLPISPLATPIFPTKVATVEALQSNMRQCSSYSEHTHLQLLNRVILPKHFNTAVEYSPWTYDCSLKTSNLHPSDLRWNAYRSQAGFSTITTLLARPSLTSELE